MSKTIRACNYCHQDYTAETRELRRGQGIYCSLSCAAKANNKKRAVVKAPNLECAWCGELFYRAPSKRGSSRSGLFFCRREHKDTAQRIGGIKDIQPDHYGTILVSYRVKALRAYPNVCASCGYDKHPEILEVNHKDCDRGNNSLENLEILCPNCHAEFHFTTSTGPWGPRT